MRVRSQPAMPAGNPVTWRVSQKFLLISLDLEIVAAGPFLAAVGIVTLVLPLFKRWSPLVTSYNLCISTCRL